VSRGVICGKKYRQEDHTGRHWDYGRGFARTTQILGFRDCMGAKVVAIASRHRDRAAEVANEFGIEHVAADWQDSSNATTSISSV